MTNSKSQPGPLPSPESSRILQTLAAHMSFPEIAFNDGTLFPRLVSVFEELVHCSFLGIFRATAPAAEPLSTTSDPDRNAEFLSLAIAGIQRYRQRFPAESLSIVDKEELAPPQRDLLRNAEGLAVAGVSAGCWTWGYVVIIPEAESPISPDHTATALMLARLLESVVLRANARFPPDSFEEAGEAISLTTPDFGFLWCNQAFEQLFGYSREELRLDGARKLLPPEDLEATAAANRNLPLGEVRKREIQIVHASGDLIPVEITIRKILVGGQESLISVIRDARERLKAQEMREELSRNALQQEKLATLGTLVAGIGHEINNPLAILSGILQRLRESPGVAENNENLEMVASALGTIQRIVKIVRGLRGYAHSSLSPQGRGRCVSLNTVVQETVDLFNAISRKNAFKIELHPDPQPLSVRADEGQLSQVVLNLLTNARDALEAQNGARLVVTTGRSGGMGWLEVRDNGPGFTTQALGRAFDPFFTTKPPGKGTGLGLTLVQKIVTAYEGSVSLGNHPEGGAVVRVEFQLCP